MPDPADSPAWQGDGETVGGATGEPTGEHRVEGIPERFLSGGDAPDAE